MAYRPVTKIAPLCSQSDLQLWSSFGNQSRSSSGDKFRQCQGESGNVFSNFDGVDVKNSSAGLLQASQDSGQAISVEFAGKRPASELKIRYIDSFASRGNAVLAIKFVSKVNSLQ